MVSRYRWSLFVNIFYITPNILNYRSLTRALGISLRVCYHAEIFSDKHADFGQRMVIISQWYAALLCERNESDYFNKVHYTHIINASD